MSQALEVLVRARPATPVASAARTAACYRSAAWRRRSSTRVGQRAMIGKDITGRNMTETVPPNIVYLHSHDTGRYIQPYGHQVPTPNIQRLADQGLLFRQAFSRRAACSGSRAALLTGEYGHTQRDAGSGAPRLPARRLRPPPRPHAARGRLQVGADRRAAPRPSTRRSIGYDRDRRRSTPRTRHVAPAAAALLRDAPSAPFFLSRRLLRDPPRVLRADLGARRALLARRPPNLPDTPETRRDMAAYKASARSLDQGVGAVLNALDEHEWPTTRSSSSPPTTGCRSRAPRRR